MRVIQENMEERIHKCKHCGSVYAYTPKDIDYFWSPTMECPICKATNNTSIFDRKVK